MGKATKKKKDFFSINGTFDDVIAASVSNIGHKPIVPAPKSSQLKPPKKPKINR